jgi:hypothetical protein
MTPGVEVPVVAIVRDALRRDFAGVGLVAFAVVVIDDEALTLQDCIHDGLKMTRVFVARSEADQAYARADFVCAEMAVLQDAVDTRMDRAQMVVEQAGYKFAEQMLEGDEGE